MNTYIPEQVNIIIGAAIITDFEEVTVGYDEEFWAFNSGSSGELTRTKNSNRLGTMSITISQGNKINAVLSTLAYTDALIPCVIQDKSGTSLHTIPLGTMMKPADADYAKSESGNRTWELKGKLIKHIVGGN